MEALHYDGPMEPEGWLPSGSDWCSGVSCSLRKALLIEDLLLGTRPVFPVMSMVATALLVELVGPLPDLLAQGYAIAIRQAAFVLMGLR